MQLQRLELGAVDLAPLARFYGDTLGLLVAYETEEDSLIVTAGASQLVFRQIGGFIGRYHFAFNIPENRLAAAQEFLRAHSIPLVAEESGEVVFSFTSWNAHAVYFFDPAGNIVEFIARHDLPNAINGTDAPFTAAEILCVSEIGLPTTDVPELTERLTQTLGIAPYKGSSADFTAMGDEHGLFIVVKTGRIWFTTRDMPAEELPIQVTAQCPHGTFVIEDMPYRIHAIDVAGQI